MIQSFFEHKGSAYRYAVDCGRVRQIADDLIISAKASKGVSNCYYDYACNQLNRIDQSCWENVNLGKRLVLALSSNYNLMKSYALSMRWIRHHILMVKSKIIK